MKIEKNRHLIILDALFNADVPISSEKFAFMTRSSVRTIKSDIAKLKTQLEKENTARLISLKGKGYVLEAIDRKKFEDLHVDVEAMKRLYYNRPIEETDRRLYIIQRILTEECVLIDEICENLFISRSPVSYDMIWVTNFLKTYDIEVRSVPCKGLVIKGSESDIRNAMVEIHCSQYHEHQQLYPYEPFNKLFYENKKVYEDVRHAMLKIVRNTEISISDLASKMIPTYLCLANNRVKEDRCINLDPAIAEELRATYDYEIAKQVCADETVKSYLSLPEEEIVNLARLLLISRDIDMRSKGTAKVPLSFIEDNARLYERVLKRSQEKLGKALYSVEFYRFIELDVQSLQLQLYLRHRFDTTKKKKMVTYIERDESLLSPIPLEMARIMVGCLQEEFAQDISEAVVTSYAAYFELLLKRIVYPYRKMRLLVTATEGLVYSEGLKEKILRKYRDFISDIEVYNLYEMRKLNFEDYDAVVHSGNLMYYAYPMKEIGYDDMDYQKDENSAMEKFLSEGYDRKRINQFKTFLNVYEDVVIDNLDSFIESLFYRYSDSSEKIRALQEDYLRKRKIIDYYSMKQRSLLILLDYKYVSRELVDIYIAREPARYHDTIETRFIIIASFDPDNDVSSLKIDNYILQYINQVDGTVERIAEDKDNTLDEIYDKIVRS